MWSELVKEKKRDGEREKERERERKSFLINPSKTLSWANIDSVINKYYTLSCTHTVTIFPGFQKH
jgi:hypothetical protein